MLIDTGTPITRLYINKHDNSRLCTCGFKLDGYFKDLWNLHGVYRNFQRSLYLHVNTILREHDYIMWSTV